jgi:hypothetical protein
MMVDQKTWFQLAESLKLRAESGELRVQSPELRDEFDRRFNH